MKIAAVVFTILFAGGIGGSPTDPKALVPGEEIHCVAEALPINSTEGMSEPTCFDTKEAVEEHLGIVTGTTNRASLASVVIGTVYANTNYGGSSYTMWGSSDCSGVTFGFASLSGGWDSQISSARAATGCWVTPYKATSYGGDKITCMPSCPSIGSLNDQVRSLVFRPEGTVG